MYNDTMNIGEILDIEIEGSGMNGEGVTRADGKVVFVPYTLKGERVRAKVKSVKKNYATASVIKVLSPSEHRIDPNCPHYYKCGGCDMGHIDGEYRRKILLDELKNNLKKIANIDFTPTEFVSFSCGTARRNKLSMPFGYVDGKVVSGLYRQNTHVVEPVTCEFATPLMVGVARTVCDFADKRHISVYDETTCTGLLRHLIIREIGGRASVTLVVNGGGLEPRSYERELGGMLPNNVDFFICPNTRKNNVILGDTVRLVKGNARLKVCVCGIDAELSPLSFFQVNDEMRDKLYAHAIGAVSAETLIDLYSGIGITSNLAARKCDKVIAVECVPQAVADADRTAALNGNSGKIKNICGKTENVLSEIARDCARADILADPPRKGCGADVARAIARFGPERFIYISCNHATMCRDIKVFTDEDHNYEITDCKVFDMFPNTHHTETLVVLRRK